MNNILKQKSNKTTFKNQLTNIYNELK